MNAYALRPLEPLVLGDGRPFALDAGAGRAGGLLMPTPATLAGAVRAAVGRQRPANERDWDAIGRIEVHGPLLVWRDEIWIPAPADRVAMTRTGDGGAEETVLLRAIPTPLREGEGSDLGASTPPLGLPYDARLRPAKKEEGPRWMSIAELSRWYREPERVWAPPASDDRPAQPSIALDPRTHVGIAFATLANETGRLYATAGASYPDEAFLTFRANEALSAAACFVGGERRQAALLSASADLWSCPTDVSDGLARARRVALVLATSGHFAAGHVPDAARLSQKIGTRLDLVGHANRPRQVVSGWRLQPPFGPKPARWLAPAGSVYLFDLPDGGGEALPEAWLRPVSDFPDACAEGFGLGLWFPVLD